MKTVMSTTSLIACAVIAGAFSLGFLSGPALAGEPQEQVKPEPFKFHFAYDPPEATARPSAEKLLIRLETEVRRYCGGTRKMSLDEHKYVDACINATMKDSVSKFGTDAVAQAYRSRADG